MSDVHYADHVDPSVGGIVVGSYVEALTWTHGMCGFGRYIKMYADMTTSSFFGLFAGCFLRNVIFEATQVVTNPYRRSGCRSNVPIARHISL